MSIVRTSQSLASAQSVTDTEADVGSVIVNGVAGADKIQFMITVDHTNSANVRFQLIGANNSGASTYVKATATVLGATLATNGTQTYYELDSDADQTIAIPWTLDKLWDRVTLQTWAGTVGTTADTVTATYKLG